MRREKEQKAAKWKETRCKKCGTTIKYNIDWAKIPDTCKSCIEKERAKWKETRCKKCGTTIKYNTDWSRVPDTCKPCVEKEKAKWKEKRCLRCSSLFKYNEDWGNIPDLCPNCQKEKKRALGAIALRESYYESLAKARGNQIYRENAEKWKEARVQDSNDFCKVKVRSGWSIERQCATTDCIISVRGIRDMHYHIVYDEYGTELISEWRRNH